MAQRKDKRILNRRVPRAHCQRRNRQPSMQTALVGAHRSLVQGLLSVAQLLFGPVARTARSASFRHRE
jgi:hypothetical protein